MPEHAFPVSPEAARLGSPNGRYLDDDDEDFDKCDGVFVAAEAGATDVAAGAGATDGVGAGAGEATLREGASVGAATTGAGVTILTV